MKVLVTGASGTLGRLVVQALDRRGVPVRGTGRGVPPPGWVGDWRRADLLSQAGLADAVAGVDAVVHCASNPKAPMEDVAALDHLMAAVRPGRGRILYVGIAGIEDAASHLAYYRAKLDGEHRLAGSGLPYTICRATQFHSFLDDALDRLGWGPLQLCPPMTLQPVDPGHVAARLAEFAIGDLVRRSLDITGPEILNTAEFTAPWLQARAYRRLCIPIPSFGMLSAWNSLRPAAGVAGGPTWRDWLASQA